MNVSYTAPLARAWSRARGMLFRPFRPETWLVLGFAAFLSEFLSSHEGGRYAWRGNRGAQLAHHMGWFTGFSFSHLALAIGSVVAVIVLAVFVVLLWVNCRGKFIFLDDVVRGRAAIVEPWKRFHRLGNSLFAWTLVFELVGIAIGVLMALPFLAAIAALFEGDEFRWAGVGALFGLLLMAIPFVIALAYVGLFLSDFIVPIMFKHDVTATAAWSRFLPLLRRHPGSFLLYGVWVFVLWAVVMCAWFFVGIATCCVGFVLLALPYIGTVVLLPAYVTARWLGPEFLAQFGEEFAVFPAEVAAGAAPGPGGAG